MLSQHRAGKVFDANSCLHCIGFETQSNAGDVSPQGECSEYESGGQEIHIVEADSSLRAV